MREDVRCHHVGGPVVGRGRDIGEQLARDALSVSYIRECLLFLVLNLIEFINILLGIKYLQTCERASRRTVPCAGTGSTQRRDFNACPVATRVIYQVRRHHERSFAMSDLFSILSPAHLAPLSRGHVFLQNERLVIDDVKLSLAQVTVKRIHMITDCRPLSTL